MQEKYQGYSVEMEVVQVIVEVDAGGKQKQRYGMWKDMVNEGKDKTTTCLSKCLFLCKD